MLYDTSTSTRPGETLHASGVVTERDDGFALKRVPLYGWAALVIIGWALYHQRIEIAVIAVSAWALVKIMRGRL